MGPEHEEWDDIVEFGAEHRQLYVTHYQVKRQQGNFKDGTIKNLFERAASILAQTDPYRGLTIPPERRRFRFVFPTDKMTDSNLGIGQLRELLDRCQGNSADTIVSTQGEALDGDQKRGWLGLICSASANDAAARRLLRQTRVELRADADVAADNQEFASLFERPDRARLLLDEAIHNLAPEGWLDAAVLLPTLQDASPRQSIRVVHVAKHEERFWVHGHTRDSDVEAVARASLKQAWSASGAADVHIALPCPAATASAEDRELRLACVRLALHARMSPVYVAGKVEWCERARIYTQRTLGGDDLAPVEPTHYADRPALAALPPASSWPAGELAAALHKAMDAWVWSEVRTHGRRREAGGEGVTFNELAAQLSGVPHFFDKTLRGWWGLELKASGTARAGPGAAPNVARLVAGLAALSDAGYSIAVETHGDHIASIGTLPVRALAIEHASVEVDGEPSSVDLSEHARGVLGHAGVVLLARGEVENYYDLADPASIDESGADASMRGTSLAFLLTAESLIAAAKIKPSSGSSAVRNRVAAWCKARAARHSEALDAAIQQLLESHAA